VPEMEIPWPVGGRNENWDYSNQPADTCRESKNVRGIDPITGRTRGAQRSGMSKADDDQVALDTPIKDMNLVVVDDKLYTYAEEGGTLVWQTESPGKLHGQAVAVGPQGDLYVIDGKDGFLKISHSSGKVIYKRSVPKVTSGQVIRRIQTDPNGGIYIAVTGGGGATDARIWKYQETSETQAEISWIISPGRVCRTMVFNKSLLYVGTGAGGGGDEPLVQIWGKIYTANPVKHVEFEVGATLGGAYSDDWDVWGMAVNDAGDIFVTQWDDPEATTNDSAISKWENDGTFLYGVQASAMPDPSGVGTTPDGGIGLDVAVNSDGDVYTIGVQYDASPGNTVRKLVDTGTKLSTLVSDGAWATDVPVTYLNYSRIAVDAFDNVYVPRISAVGAGQGVKVFKSTGLAGAAVEEEVGGFSMPDNNPPVALALPLSNPDYGEDDVDRAEFLYTVTEKAVSLNNDSIVFKHRLVDITQTTGSARSFRGTVATGGNLKVFDSAFAISDPQGGTGIFDTNGNWVQSTVLFREVFFTDGRDYNVYRPLFIENDADGEVFPYRADIGEIPPRCKLIETWRGRIVLARDPEDPHNWHMSKAGDAYNWNQFPANVQATTAISGNNSPQVGLIPDIVNAVVPYNDDLLLFGGDHSLYRLTGDPMAGGSIDLVSDVTGMSFGRPWVKDPDGRLFFVGSRGGVYVMNPFTGAVDRISRHRVERSLQDIDFELYHTKLVWNYREEGLHVFLLPYGSGGTLVSHWFWDEKNDAWWEDKYGITADTTRQPTAALLYDADDPDDRIVLLGSEDGFLRKWDETARDDDGLAIDAFVTIGPLIPASSGREFRFRRLNVVLDSAQQGVNYELYTSDTPDKIPTLPVAQGKLGPGRNPSQLVRARGSVAWLRLRQRSLNQRFAYESGSLEASPSGRARSRVNG